MKKQINTFLMTVAIAAGSYGLIGCGAEFNDSTSDNSVDDSNDVEDNNVDSGDVGEIGVVFNNVLSANWETYDCCGDTIAVIVNDNEHGSVVEFTGVIDDTNMGFVATDMIDLSTFSPNSTLNFDLKIISFPTTIANTDWAVKVQSNGGPYSSPAGEEGAVTVRFEDLPAENTWKSFSFSLSDMENEGLDLTSIDKIAISPNYGAANGVVYYLDNVELVDAENTESSELVIITDVTKDLTTAWRTTGAVGVNSYFYNVATDTDYMDRARFEISTESDLGNGVDSGNTTAQFEMVTAGTEIDVDAYSDTGVLSFDMKLRSSSASNAGDYTWNVRLYGGGTNVNLDLTSDSQEQSELIVDEFVHFTYDLSDFAGGITMTSIDQIRIYPAFGTLADVQYDIANLRFYQTGTE